MGLIELIGTGKNFGERRVLADINLSIDDGEFVSIVGSSASGKSSLLKIACGLMEPSSGSVTMHGERVAGFSRKAAIVFQNYSLLPWFSALENVRLAVEAAWPEWKKAEQTAQAEKILQMVGLGAALSKRPSQLSGGMRQRVAIARAFAVEPEILFLDEPFGALDALTRATLQMELARLCNEMSRKVTVLMITNSVDEAILLSDRILALSKGPGATLSPAVPVPIARPRAGNLLMEDEQAVRIRARLAEFLVDASRGNKSKNVMAGSPAAQRIPAEAGA